MDIAIALLMVIGVCIAAYYLADAIGLSGKSTPTDKAIQVLCGLFVLYVLVIVPVVFLMITEFYLFLKLLLK